MKAHAEMATARRTSRTLAAGLVVCRSASAYDHLRTQSTVGIFLRHPAFAGFAHLILTWVGSAYDASLPLTGIDSLLPDHSHVDPDTVASALNRMTDDASSGRPMFYRFYSEAQIAQDSARQNTGLFFFRGRVATEDLAAAVSWNIRNRATLEVERASRQHGNEDCSAAQVRHAAGVP